jgi:hypothetical protein
MITGERIQELCDIYCGDSSDFDFNPRIKSQKNKHMKLDNIVSIWDNPTYIFCYGHRLTLFMEKIHFFKNKFILISHNSDENITEKYLNIANHPMIKMWYAQNVLFEHPKLILIPIGIANSSWAHGSLNAFNIPITNMKTKDIYFFFNLYTNKNERFECYNEILKKGLSFGNQLNYYDYIKELSLYKYAICPPGNGVDCHRLWECLYLGVIPILKRSIFTEKIAKSFKCVIVDKWEDLSIEKIMVEYVQPPNYPKLNMNNIREAIINIEKPF